VHWTSLGLALPTRPSWVVPTGDSHPWAPSALERPQPCPGATKGPCFVMYHVGTSRQFRTDCVGLATSPDPEGPWTERGILQDTSGARDASGRPPTVTFQDHDPPATSITAGPRGPTRFASARVRFAASETGTFACSLDGAPAGPCSSPYVTPRLSDGRHALTVTATDAAGNVDPTPAARSWTTDTRAPATSIARGPRGFVRSSRATFSFRATEPGASFHCSLDRERARTCRGRTAFTRLAPGPHTLLVRARDRAGSTDRRGRRRGWVVLGATRRVGLRIAPRQRGRLTFAVRCAASCRARIVATVAGRTAGALTVRRPGRAVLAVRAPGRGPVTVLLTARRTDGPGIATALTTLIRSRRP